MIATNKEEGGEIIRKSLSKRTRIVSIAPLDHMDVVEDVYSGIWEDITAPYRELLGYIVEDMRLETEETLPFYDLDNVNEYIKKKRKEKKIGDLNFLFRQATNAGFTVSVFGVLYEIRRVNVHEEGFALDLLDPVRRVRHEMPVSDITQLEESAKKYIEEHT